MSLRQRTSHSSCGVDGPMSTHSDLSFTCLGQLLSESQETLVALDSVLEFVNCDSHDTE